MRMRILILLISLSFSACTSDLTSTADGGGDSDLGEMSDGGPADGGIDSLADMGTREVDMSAAPDMTSEPDMTPEPDMNSTCVDTDQDGWYVECADYDTFPGPDCDDSDPDNWVSCSSCVDSDSDMNFVGCDRYTLIDGPDCNDSDPDNWVSCASCVDSDMDMAFVGCDRYTLISGPDCADGDEMRYPGNTEVQGNGIDDDCDGSTSDMVTSCTYTPTPATNPEPGALAGVTAAHNEWRWRVGTTPLVWNTTLAAQAQAWADNCQSAHSTPQQRNPGSGFTYVGEEIHTIAGQVTNQRVLSIVPIWSNGRAVYDFGAALNVSNQSPYTQMVWKDTTDIGCGVADCQYSFGDATFLVCRYGPSQFSGQTAYDYDSSSCVDLDNDDVWQFQDADDTDRTVQ